jgi:hypothetical protein
MSAAEAGAPCGPVGGAVRDGLLVVEPQAPATSVAITATATGRRADTKVGRRRIAHEYGEDRSAPRIAPRSSADLWTGATRRCTMASAPRAHWIRTMTAGVASMPFYWLGALFALAFLTIVITIFGLLLELGSRAATEVRGSILPGLITGIRNWADDREPIPPAISPRSDDRGSSPHETATLVRPQLEPVRRQR